MSVHGDFKVFDQVTPIHAEGQLDDEYNIVETYWGYIVECKQASSRIFDVTQVMAWLLGAAFMIAALGLWFMPSTVATTEVLEMKLGATAFCLASSLFCLWYSSRGTESEIQIDTRLGEVREVVRNRAGRSTLVGRYGFDAIGSVFIDMGGKNQRDATAAGRLVLRYRNTSQTLHVAAGAVGKLGKLRDRLGHDLMIAPNLRTALPTPKFQMAAA